MNNFVNINHSFFIPDKTYSKILEHLDSMNNWKISNDSILKSKEGCFTFEDSFIDLIAKGVISYHE